MEGLNHKIGSLYLLIPTIHDKEHFSCGMCINTTMQIFLLGTLKILLKFFKILTTVLDKEKNLHSSVDEHLLLLMTSKIDYLTSKALNNGLPVEHIASDYMATSRVISRIFSYAII